MLSIVIPVFKSSKTLLRTLHSVDSSSKGFNIGVEVVVVLDGPDSQCEDVFNDWQKSSSLANALIRKAHSGVSASRNAGAKASRGRYLTFLDSDDEITAHRIAATRELLQNQILIGRQKISPDSFQIYLNPEAERNIAPSEHHIISLVMNRMKFLETGGFDEDYSVGSDWEFLVRAKTEGLEIVYSQEVFLTRHLHDGNASHNHQALKQEYLAAVRKHLKQK